MTVAVDWVQERLEKSPVRSLRKQRYPNRSVLCNLLGISDSVIYFSEMACYPRIPYRLNHALLPESETRRDFRSTYYEFQVSERQVFGELHGLNNLELDSNPGAVQALCAALSLSRADLGKGLCLQPSLIYRHDRGFTGSLSEEFRIALRQAGLTTKVLALLETMQRKYNADNR